MRGRDGKGTGPGGAVRAWAGKLLRPAGVLALGLLLGGGLPGQSAGKVPFRELFARAVRALPPQQVVTARCSCPGEKRKAAAFAESLALLRKARLLPGAGEKALDILADALGELARVKGALFRPGGMPSRGLLPAPFRLLLGRIQCAAKLVQWELEARSRKEPRPLPETSPLTEYVSRVLDLAFLSPEGGALVLRLLGEQGASPKKRAFFLRGVHLAFLKEKGAGKAPGEKEPAWRAGIRRALVRVARENQEILARRRGGRVSVRDSHRGEWPGGKDPSGRWRELKQAWDEAAGLSEGEAFRVRERRVTSFLEEERVPALALRGADLFYRTYPGFCSLGLRGWANLAWKEGAFPAIRSWIRARWKDPVFRAGVADALQGLCIGAGLVRRKDRILLEDFFVEIWKRKDLPFPLRARALLGIARSVSLPPGKAGALLLEAFREWRRKGGGPWREILARALAEHLEGIRAAGPSSGEEELRPRLEEALRFLEKAGRKPGKGGKGPKGRGKGANPAGKEA